MLLHFFPLFMMKISRRTTEWIRRDYDWWQKQIQHPKAAIISQFVHLSNRHNPDCNKWWVRQTHMAYFTFLSFSGGVAAPRLESHTRQHEKLHEKL